MDRSARRNRGSRADDALEAHGRADTAALVDHLEVIARRRVAYRGATLEEIDLEAILARAPELCLIDELAHSNAPAWNMANATRTSPRS